MSKSSLREKIERVVLDEITVNGEGVAVDAAIEMLIGIARREFLRGKEAA